ncbi:MAG: hypothetical protein ACRDPJ_01490 [Nocardioidaceae bacterium]
MKLQIQPSVDDRADDRADVPPAQLWEGPEPVTHPAAEGRRATRWMWPLGVCLVTALYSMLPPLLGSEFFYVRGDSGSQFLPTWFHLGELTRDGAWPPLMDPGAWAGGNYAAESLFGVYNPLNVLIWLGTTSLPDLLVAAAVTKSALMTLLALGTYLLTREYGAAAWAAASVAVAVPFTGYTVYWDAATWASGLVAFAYVPWVWWAFRKVARDTMSPLWGFLVGALAVTQGNPYGVVAVVVIGVAVVVEASLTSNKRGLVRTLLLGACVAAVLPLVFLPLMETVPLTVRAQLDPLGNSGFMRPSPGDFLQLSSPTYLPSIRTFNDPMSVPAIYLAWFVVPLLPWLRFGALRGQMRLLSGVAVFSAAYLLLTLTPSKLWMFRWPLRLVEYLYLGLAVLLAVLLSHGLCRDRWRERTAWSAGLIGFTTYLVWAEVPEGNAKELLGAGVLVVLTGVLLAVHRWFGTRPFNVFAMLTVGTGVVLSTQTLLIPENESAGSWHFPHDVSSLQEHFDDRDGTFLQFAEVGRIRHRSEAKLERHWSNFLFGSMYHVAGVDAVNNYSGMGYRDFTERLCMNYNAVTNACGFRYVWEPVKPEEAPLVDLMKVDTIAVQRSLTPKPQPGPEWSVERQDRAWLLRRVGPQPWPESRLSAASPDVAVSSATERSHYTERVSYSTTGSGPRTLTFARLAWPGYVAEVDGHRVDVRPDAAGLITVEVPESADMSTLTLTYRPPGQVLGLLLTVAGAAGAAVLSVLRWRRRRSRAVG